MALSTAQRKEMRQLLERIIAQTEADILTLKSQTKPISPDNAIGRISRMDAINNKSVADAGLRTSQARLSKLQRNLERLEEPEFGDCTRCGNAIQFGRLRIMPETGWCIHCASRR